MKLFAAALATFVLASPLQAQEEPDLEIWRLDCGTIAFSDSAAFSDAHLYDGKARTLVASCYLLRNGTRYLLWDAGLPSGLIGTGLSQGGTTLSLERSIADQLSDIGVTTEQVTYAGVSHFHFDHTGQLSDFSGSTLLIGAGDWDVVKETKEPNPLVDPRPFAAWLGEEGAEVVAFPGDHDVFGDGSVVMKAMPGHTPGHTSLLVRLPETGNLLLTGDLYHFEEQIDNRGVPSFNTNRADTLASFERFNAIAKSLDATVLIQHDPRHLGRLPTFPGSAK